MKRLAIIILCIALCLTACVAPQTRTRVIEETQGVTETPITVKSVHTLPSSVMNFLGFDSKGHLIGMRNEGTRRGFYSVNVDSGEETCIAEIKTRILNAGISRQGEYVTYETLHQKQLQANLLELSKKETQTVGTYQSKEAVVRAEWTDEDGCLSYVLKDQDDFLLYAYDQKTKELEQTQLSKVLPSMMTSQLSKGVTVNDAFVMKEQRAVVQATKDGATYLMVLNLDASQDRNVIVSQSSQAKAVSAKDHLFYLNANHSLMMLDVQKNEEVELGKNIRAFAVGKDGKVVAYTVKEKDADKVYVKKTSKDAAVLVDIRQNASYLRLSADGTKLLVRYTENAVESNNSARQHYQYIVYDLEL